MLSIHENLDVLLHLLRDKEKNFAPVIAGMKARRGELAQKGSLMEESIKPHPLLSRSQQFSGIDTSLNAIPSDNSYARELYPQLRQAARLTHAKKKGAAPVLKR